MCVCVLQTEFAVLKQKYWYVLPMFTHNVLSRSEFKSDTSVSVLFENMFIEGCSLRAS